MTTYVWPCGNGVKLYVCEMSDTHTHSAIIGLKSDTSYGNLYIDEWPDYEWVSIFEDELKKREKYYGASTERGT